MTKVEMEELQKFLKTKGFIFQGSEIYGGLANTYDYGPLGILLNRNLKDYWWNFFINCEPNNFGLDSKILMNPEVWVASGHVNKFSDPLIENKVNNKRYRADHLIEKIDANMRPETMNFEEMEVYIKTHLKTYEGVSCDWTKIREFRLMFETYQGVVQGNKDAIFLRPETAQGIFVNFHNVQKTMAAKVPFGIGQIGRVFRNEVTPGNYIFRTREFEQMELEFFTHPNEDEKHFNYYVNKSKTMLKNLGLSDENVRERVHAKEELAHYSKATVDFEFNFPFGWGELMGIANRTDFDLQAHSKHAKVDLSYLDPYTNERYFPYVIEPSIGLDRLILAILCQAYTHEVGGESTRLVLKLKPFLAPYIAAILPLNKNAHSDVARALFIKLKQSGLSIDYDESGSIGKRYRHQDSIGTPICITVIDDTVQEKLVTIRERDTMVQTTVKIDELIAMLKDLRAF